MPRASLWEFVVTVCVELFSASDNYDFATKALSHQARVFTIHDAICLMQSVIPGLTRNPGFFWIPAFAGMTRYALINVAMYKQIDCPGERSYG